MSSRPILICFDGSADSLQAVARAGELFPGRHAVVLHVWEPLGKVASVPPVPGLRGMLQAGLEEMDKIGEDISRDTAERGAEAARAAALDAEPLSIQASGRAWQSILEVASDRDAAAIVIGRRGVSGAEHALLGSVSNAVVHHADRPVLVVPEAGASPG